MTEFALIVQVELELESGDDVLEPERLEAELVALLKDAKPKDDLIPFDGATLYRVTRWQVERPDNRPTS